jgi:hypothetical protein
MVSVCLKHGTCHKQDVLSINTDLTCGLFILFIIKRVPGIIFIDYLNFSATGRSLVQRTPTKCRVCLSVIK